MSDLTALGVAVLLLIANAFFVGAEFALISARRTQIEPRAEAGSRFARITLRAMENVSLMMAGAQLGITMASLGLGAVGEPAVAHLLEPLFEAVGLPEGLVHPVALVVALAIVVTLHMVLGEMVPKNIAIAGPERSAIVLGPLLYGFVTVLKPVIVALNALANVVLRVIRVQPQDEVTSTFTADEVAGFIAQSRREGLLDDDEHDLLTGALEFTDATVRAVVLGVDDLVTVPRTSASPTWSRSAPAPASPGSPWSTTAATCPATCTSRTCSAWPRPGVTSRCTASGCGRSSPSGSISRCATRWRPCRHAGRTWPGSSTPTTTGSWAWPRSRTCSRSSSATSSTPASTGSDVPRSVGRAKVAACDRTR